MEFTDDFTRLLGGNQIKSLHHTLDIHANTETEVNSRCLIGMFLGVHRHTEAQFRDGPGYVKPGMGLQVSFISHES